MKVQRGVELNFKKRRALALLEAEPEIKAKEIAERLGFNVDVVRRWLRDARKAVAA